MTTAAGIGQRGVALRAAGCQVGQGFCFSRPLPAAGFGDLLTRHCTPEAALPLGTGVHRDEP